MVDNMINKIEFKNLANLDVFLAEIIRDSLIQFRDNLPPELMLYSKEWKDAEWHSDENVTDDTQWFLNELIWTFTYLANDSSSASMEPLVDNEDITESGMLFAKMYNELKGEEIGINDFLEKLETHPDYALYKGMQRRERERAKEGLKLFAEYYQALWY
jgi:hypothetical protein